jgi:hypothetical protein
MSVAPNKCGCGFITYFSEGVIYSPIPGYAASSADGRHGVFFGWGFGWGFDIEWWE